MEIEAVALIGKCLFSFEIFKIMRKYQVKDKLHRHINIFEIEGEP